MAKQTYKSLEERLLQTKQVNPLTGCWESTLKKNVRTGYVYYKHKSRLSVSAHRLSYMVFKGDIPVGLHVRHLCHNKICINPEHLAVGTRLENAHDSWKDGRYRPQKGEAHGQSKLTAIEVMEIRKLFVSGIHPVEIGKKYGIRRGSVYNLVNGNSWRHLG